MRILVASLLLLVGTCSNKRHSERVKDLKESVNYDNKIEIETYLNTISEKDLKKHLFEIASDKYEGRKAGENGHNQLCNYLKDFYKTYNINAPSAHPNYFQNIPSSELPESINSTQNVIAYIKGSDLPNEYLIVSAHSDHLGIENGEIHNGADDNGSGTSAILEIAEAFLLAKKQGINPKRSIVFLHATAEELGLIGSNFYTANPVFPLENTVANLNTDMIGRVDKRHENNPNYVYVIGSDRISTELDFIVREANETFTHLNLDYKYNDKDDPNRYYNRSDHYNFALKNIPVVFFFNGEHEDYHKASDTVEKINFEILKKRTQLIFATAWYIANAENAPSKEVL
ncbi:M28 family metallopeptidase [Winogradskyella litorisediminis]|uniref:M28 family metallopeptidase n=1 Tax=Winogradskyella litorisediminis TaxID=1156618 RepID=A0ABW3N9H5_9FLAO